MAAFKFNTGQDLLPHSAALPKVVNRRPPGRGGFLEKTGGRTKGETAQIPPQELPQQLSGRSRTYGKQRASNGAVRALWRTRSWRRYSSYPRLPVRFAPNAAYMSPL